MNETKTNRWKRLPKGLRIVVIVFVSFLLLNVLAWFGTSWYIHSHKQELLQKISAKVSENLNGNFHINDMEPVLLRGFPNLAVELNGVTLSDSLYTTYHINLIDVQSAYVKLNIFSLLTRHPKIIKVTLANGTFHLFSDSTFSNGYLLKFKRSKDSASKKKNNNRIDFENFGLQNITFNIENKTKPKQLLFTVNSMNGSIHSSETGMDIHADSKIHVAQLGFNLNKGGYLSNKNIDADFHLLFHKEKKDLSMPVQRVKINGTTLLIGADFNFGNNPQIYSLNIHAPSIGFKDAVSILTQKLQKTLQPFNLKNNLSVKATVDGHLSGPDDPVVLAKWQVKNNDFTAPFGVMQNATFTGAYYNNVIPNQGHGDDNSQIALDSLNALFYGIPVKMKDVRMFNLTHPLLDFKLTSDFPVEKLNGISGSTFFFDSGRTNININYHGGIVPQDTLGHTLTGKIHIENAAFFYVPSNIHFQKGNVNLVFDKHNLILDNTTLATLKSDISMSGSASNFMNLYFTNPGKIVFNWNVESKHLALDEFKGMIDAPKKTGSKNSNQSLENINEKLEYIMRNSTANLHLRVANIAYKTFSAHDLDATANLSPDNLSLNNANVKFAGGNIHATISAAQGRSEVPFRMKANAQGVDVDKLFTAFADFGQSSLTAKNIDGSFSANVDVQGNLTQQADLVKNSLNGKISFVLTDGHLINYKPLLSVQKYVFKKRDLANVAFKTIRNNFSISDGKITIPPMTIASNVIELNLQGVYAIDKGTDIGIDVPLRDPQKAEERRAQGKKVRKGIVVHLRARDDVSGKVRLVWDPFHKAPQKEDMNND
ncbi:hypothetical protein A9P82_03205 [Arachidicoccus ginsenosidimutans]|uniref:AsmA family protein n=1 Tax=Arachidicoccus sp. BS20 TaxID=1850526 RepID=UPI0007F0A052|nr:AsmA family protein [Arachidicoccus sp. BS20]ANI88394.1 hypothetical protein A9P82_03205 [Arachidicoccus sp. BS20]